MALGDAKREKQSRSSDSKCMTVALMCLQCPTNKHVGHSNDAHEARSRWKGVSFFLVTKVK